MTFTSGAAGQVSLSQGMKYSLSYHVFYFRGLGFSLDFPVIEIPRTAGDDRCESYLMVESRGAQTYRLCGQDGSHLNTESAGPSNNLSVQK